MPKVKNAWLQCQKQLDCGSDNITVVGFILARATLNMGHCQCGQFCKSPWHLLNDHICSFERILIQNPK